MSRSRKSVLSSIAVVIVIAIAVFPIGTCGISNTRLPNHSESSGYRFEKLPTTPTNSNDIFVVLTFSGGGTRAAALAYGVLLELASTSIIVDGSRRRLLDEVDVISSVSGGSFTAAYYGLFRERTFQTFERDFLHRNITRDLGFAVARPDRALKLAITHYNRSDVAGEVYQQSVFGGKTFQQLADNGRPFIIINATDTSRGSPFEFTQAQFDLLCSDLSKFELGRAVAASAAFPMLLSPIRLDNHGGKCGFTENDAMINAAEDKRINPYRYRKLRHLRSYSSSESRPYVHLIDGGIGDNLGLHAIIDAFNEDLSELPIRNFMENQKAKKIVIIAVDAGTEADDSLDQEPATPDAVNVVKRSAYGPIDNYSFQLLDNIRISMDNAAPDDGNVTLHLIHVNFDWLPDTMNPAFYKSLPTTLHLSPEIAAKVRDAGRIILRHDPKYQKLLRELL